MWQQNAHTENTQVVEVVAAAAAVVVVFIAVVLVAELGPGQ